MLHTHVGESENSILNVGTVSWQYVNGTRPSNMSSESYTLLHRERLVAKELHGTIETGKTVHKIHVAFTEIFFMVPTIAAVRLKEYSRLFTLGPPLPKGI